ncbi:hypothetical protein SAMN05443572_104490 [Myxococcus fulvus]|uniref:Lipoprotein n=1 Tax=Myxococcus fulvus TaxID=33 RepID=A0A511SYA8_MYXFU|nr:hypothetical protein [Myxococcus fulvus]AKF83910.1 hypothetical protein MFUL124B02_38855 [Myxococcus fulvus 124B02]GEN06885.1 hypothetical protein MFU01_19220 [Myxococcus fulvus]SEU03557.1 hypothetical protein SAMN05443572_104490 [Myxococcus fulvus]
MKKLILSAVAASSLIGCTSVESAVVSGTEIAANGEAVAVIQTNALGLTAIFHIIDIVQSDLDTVVNKLLIAEAKAMGASKVDLKTAGTTPRHGIYALFGTIIGVTSSSATGVAVK